MPGLLPLVGVYNHRLKATLARNGPIQLDCANERPCAHALSYSSS
jgi:hypothetical protein